MLLEISIKNFAIIEEISLNFEQGTQEHRRVCVVGDDAQSIYGFRGANIDNILDFQKILKTKFRR